MKHSPFLNLLSIFSVLLLTGVIAFSGISQAQAWMGTAGQPVTAEVHTAGQPWVNLGKPQSLSTLAEEAGIRMDTASEHKIPLSLVSADLNTDGEPDLLAGYGGDAGGSLMIYLGQSRESVPVFDAALPDAAAVLPLPVLPDFLAAGSVNEDEWPDLIAAARGGKQIWLLPGKGAGEFAEAQSLDLPGAITAFTSGELNRQDGRLDLAVAVQTEGAYQVLVFSDQKGPFASSPETFTFNQPITALIMGQFDAAYPYDLAVTSGSQLALIHGRDASFNKASQADVSTFELGFSTVSAAAGDFISRQDMLQTIALLGDDGALHFFDPSGKTQPPAAVDAINASLPEDGSLASDFHQVRLIRAKTSSLNADDLLVIDEARGKARLVNMEDAASPILAELETSTRLAAVLPLRLNGDGLTDLVLWAEGQSAPQFILTEPVHTFYVGSNGDKSDKNPGDGICDSENYDWHVCTLRAAIEEANASPGADAIFFKLYRIPPGYDRPVIIPETPLPNITESVTVDATSSPYGMVYLDGSQLGPHTDGLGITGSASVIARLGIFNFQGNGIEIFGNGNTISSCNIGTNASGDSGLGNDDYGVYISASSNIIENSLISGNAKAGIRIQGLGGNQILQGNGIGTGAGSSQTPLPNKNGIEIYASANNTVGNNTSSHNHIAGNLENGILISAGSAGNQIRGAWIGINKNLFPMGNRLNGVLVQADANTIAGASHSGNDSNTFGDNQIGILVDKNIENTTIKYNNIGLNFSMTTKLPQKGAGVYVSSLVNAVEIADNYFGNNIGGGATLNGFPGEPIPPCVNYNIYDNIVGALNHGNQGNGMIIGPAQCLHIYDNRFEYNANDGLSIESTFPATGTISGNYFNNNGIWGASLMVSQSTISYNAASNNGMGGLDLTGVNNQLLCTTALNNTWYGISVTGDENTISSSNFSGSSAVISGNYDGLLLNGNNNVVKNYAIHFNLNDGIHIFSGSSGNLIGGTATSDRNLIYGNGRGLVIEAQASNNQVVNNAFGDDGGNGLIGLLVMGSNNLIGGDSYSKGNSFANTTEIAVMFQGTGATGNVFRSNMVGKDKDGMDAPNGQGIIITDGASRNQIIDNTILNSQGAGIQIRSGSGNWLYKNRIYQNGGMGVDLYPAGVTMNDMGDGDSGANQLQNYPVIASALVDTSGTHLQGMFSSAPSATYTLGFFKSAACDSNGYGEGESHIITQTVTTDSNGNAAFDILYPYVPPLGQYITANATDKDGNTSEFSRCVLVQAAGAVTPIIVNDASDQADPIIGDGICDVATSTAGEQCTLRAAIQTANNNGNGADTILLPPWTYFLTRDGAYENAANTGDLDITEALTLTGSGANVTIVQSSVSDRVFEIRNSAAVTLAGITIQNGNSSASAGAGILSGSGCTLTLDGVAVMHNQTTAGGGGIFSQGNLVLTGSTVASNTASLDGGGIYQFGGYATLTNSTLSSNASNQNGGGFYATNTSVLLANVTVYNNTADADNASGGGGGGVYSAGTTTFTLRNSIVAGNFDLSASPYPHGLADCAGTLTSGGYNLIGDKAKENNANPPGCVITSSNDTIGGFWIAGVKYLTYTAGLGPLQLNGGTTPNHSPYSFAAGQAVDNANPADPGSGGSACELFDQRGQMRPLDGGTDGIARCDCGAVEHIPAYLSISDATVSEGGTATFVVSLSEAAQVTLTVRYATQNDTALGGSDFISASGTLTFEEGDTQKVVSITVLTDTQNETDETFRVVLSQQTYVFIADGEGIGTIQDSSPIPSLQISSASAVEGTSAVFTVTLNSSSGLPVEVDFSLASQTALPNQDYSDVQGHLIFNPGVTSQTMTVSLIDDSLQEGSETFRVILSNPVNATLGTASSTGTIIDNDVPAFSISNAMRAEGTSGTAVMYFTVQLSLPSTQSLTVKYITSPGTASSGSDYIHTSGTLTFAAGETRQLIAVTLNGDTIWEATETFTVTLNTPSGGAVISSGTGTGYIINGDGEIYEVFMPYLAR
ncbi:MAG TPA: Calx-beta domain-containing protein [Anaerolineaceae bacterium]|nr:Calx-beta domain-containing protein [Anaerolineaceae bacterium]HPN52641.1 Calx-beta domain-containing protein [Anaerolineaceae bacterium]